MIVVLVNGRPLAIPRIADHASAIVEAWYVGQEGGTAIGEVLFGDVNPGGKLPVTIPRSVGQLPVYYNRRPTSFRPYLDMTREPLWPFGHGMSYTTFSISDPTITPASITPDGRATVSVDVANTGTRDGDEVVQLYLHDVVSSVTRPVLELRGFKRVTLAPGDAPHRVVHDRAGRALAHQSGDAAGRRARPVRDLRGRQLRLAQEGHARRHGRPLTANTPSDSP